MSSLRPLPVGMLPALILEPLAAEGMPAFEAVEPKPLPRMQKESRA
jgi:hypothetical protein